ncbi:MAG: EamA family transporter [Pseudomonadota bacterium]|jgi:drug/metabolite transporter (DMT)-like permease
MIGASLLWVWCTVAAAAAQTARNAMQRGLVDTVGTAGATHVRFLYGLPFALLFLIPVWASGAIVDPRLDSPRFWAWLGLGAASQALATGMMLVLMQRRSFVVSTAYIKTEPVQIALFGFLFLGDRLGPSGLLAVCVATLGVVMLSWPSAARGQGDAAPGDALRAAALGIATGAAFSVSAVAYRGAILALGDGPVLGRASLSLVLALALQTVLLSAWLRIAQPGALGALVRAWRPSVKAGFLGALASQFWFAAFALQTAAAVRTVGLVEVLFAWIVSRRLFAQGASLREIVGIGLTAAGVALLLLAGG